MADYRPDTCAYCQHDTWCETRSDGSPQCRACKIERFFERVLYGGTGYVFLPWVKQIVRDLYGNIDPADGRRIYRKAYISTAKQNGKSFLEGGLPLYHILMEDEMQPEAYGLASARDQAAIVFRAATFLIEGDRDLQDQLKVLDSTKRIIRRDGGGFYAVLSAEGKIQDGKRPSLMLVDELHRFTKKSADTVMSVLKKGMISREKNLGGVTYGEPLMIQTTTAGSEHESPLWHSEYEYAKRVIDGTFVDPKYYARIWGADPKRIEEEPDYWKSREARVAANPSHEDNGGYLTDEAIAEEVREALVRPEKKNEVIRLNLNVPVDLTETPIIEMPLWLQGGGGEDLRTWPVYDEQLLMSKWGLADRPCVLGIDLAWTTDFTAVVALFLPTPEDPVWRVLSWSWVPEDRVSFIEGRTRAPLKDWIARGFLRTCPGAEMDLEKIEQHIRWCVEMFDTREICFDPWGGMRGLAKNLVDKKGYVMVEVRQGYQSISAATKKFLGCYMSKSLIHGNNPVMNWHASCLALLSDGGDNVKPNKPARDVSQKRIDTIAALVTAMARAEVLPSPKKSVYATRGIRTL